MTGAETNQELVDRLSSKVSDVGQREAADRVPGVTQKDTSRWRRNDWEYLTGEKRRVLKALLPWLGALVVLVLAPSAPAQEPHPPAGTYDLGAWIYSGSPQTELYQLFGTVRARDGTDGGELSVGFTCEQDTPSVRLTPLPADTTRPPSVDGDRRVRWRLRNAHGPVKATQFQAARADSGRSLRLDSVPAMKLARLVRTVAPVSVWVTADGHTYHLPGRGLVVGLAYLPCLRAVMAG